MIDYQILLTKAYELGLILDTDLDYINNKLAIFFNQTAEFLTLKKSDASIEAIIETIIDEGLKQGLIESDIESQDRFVAELMDHFIMRPSTFNAHFNTLFQASSIKATNWFYTVSQFSQYIKTKRIAKNQAFKVVSDYGEIDITINLSKPEKDAKSILKEKHTVSTNYPKCLLCKENVGFFGHAKHPSRVNHRIIKTTVNEETFYLQYSPYSYYKEHLILFHEDHIPMEITHKTFKRLLDFVEMFPQYFIGSNAGLPIVGGSILSHEHYQGGHFDFPIGYAKTLRTYEINQVKYEHLYWPLSVIRITTKDKSLAFKHAYALTKFYETYSDEHVGLIAKTTEQHNAVTPIVRKVEDTYIIDLALRNNRTNDTYPDGIFHPHKAIHPIKKENIGLIEVMGLAILPGRLAKDLEHIETCLQTDKALPKNLEHYQIFVDRLKLNKEASLNTQIKEAVGQTFVKGLEHCGVFKQTPVGLKAMHTFMESYLDEHKNL